MRRSGAPGGGRGSRRGRERDRRSQGGSTRAPRRHRPGLAGRVDRGGRGSPRRRPRDARLGRPPPRPDVRHRLRVPGRADHRHRLLRHVRNDLAAPDRDRLLDRTFRRGHDPLLRAAAADRGRPGDDRRDARLGGAPLHARRVDPRVAALPRGAPADPRLQPAPRLSRSTGSARRSCRRAWSCAER